MLLLLGAVSERVASSFRCVARRAEWDHKSSHSANYRALGLNPNPNRRGARQSGASGEEVPMEVPEGSDSESDGRGAGPKRLTIQNQGVLRNWLAGRLIWFTKSIECHDARRKKNTKPESVVEKI